MEIDEICGKLKIGDAFPIENWGCFCETISTATFACKLFRIGLAAPVLDLSQEETMPGLPRPSGRRLPRASFGTLLK
jgi:hypothetical protein